jgi:ferric-dicitrate binding protein FerR (iron transport regulator)
MSLTKERIHYLLDTYLSKKATPMEESELMEWILEAKEDSELRNYVLRIWNENKSAEDLSYVNWDEIYSSVIRPKVVSLQPKVRQMRWVKLTAAAAIFIALAAGAYFYLAPQPNYPVATSVKKVNDIGPPSGTKAVLTLADGSKIVLDSTGNGILAVQGNVKITKQGIGGISYMGTPAGKVSYNTLSVPRGSRPLNLTLSDGTRVWINVGSSLTYPTAFTGKERKVTMTGEAYFEVAHNSSMPFLVQHNDATVKVLGTHFNVNSYEDEFTERITLLEGSVRVSQGTSSGLLKPGQQARINNDGNNGIKIVNDVDVNEVMAWKDGKFMFDKNTDIYTIMRQVSRWYNVDVEYQGKINQRFWGSISKDVNVSQVLKILEAAGGIKFKVEENKIIVMSKSS